MPGYADRLTRKARQWLVLVVRECPERKHDVLWAAFTGVAVFLITFARDPSAWNSIWAEDGAVFLTASVDQGFGSLFHFWAGYINTVPRVGALIAAALPLSIAPAVMTTYAVAIVGICGATVEALSGAFIEGRWAPSLFLPCNRPLSQTSSLASSSAAPSTPCGTGVLRC